MDYDKVEIADRYDAGRQYRPEVLRRWLDLLAAHAPGGGIVRIVDLGCGTGRYSEALAAHFDASVVGVDPSEKTSTSSCFGGRRRGPPRTPHGPPDDPVLASLGNQR